jgi:hypothetical protein
MPMTWMAARWTRAWWTCAPWALAAACGDFSEEGALGADGSGLTGAGTEGGASASASAGDSNSGGADDTGGPPPEEEPDADFRVPRASGRFVYSASELTDSVAVIDSTNLAIDVVGVGRGPSVVVPILGSDDDGGHVAVLDQRSNDVALLTTTAAFTSSVVVREVTAGANNLAVSPDGAYVFVYHDVDGPEALGVGSDQEVTVLDIAGDTTYAMTVGAHPREIVFSADSARAYVVTDDGVNVVPVADLAILDKPDVIPVVSDPGVDPSTVEIHVAADRDVALSRVEGETEIVATDLVTRAQYSFALPNIPTDLDLAPDGSFAILTTPSTAGSRFWELALPVDAGSTPVPYELPTEYVGLAQIAPGADAIVLFTSVNPFVDGSQVLGGTTGGSSSSDGGGTSTGESSSSDGGSTGGSDTGPDPDADPRLRVTLVRRDGDAWGEAVTLFVDDPIQAVGIAPDGANALLLHTPDAADESPVWAYTLLDLSKTFPVKKRQTIETSPGPVLFSPEGDRAVVLLRDDALGVQRIDRVDLRTFIVESLALGSPPEGAGYVDATAKIFVAQEHPTGRITFIDAGGDVQTVTGFRLNDAVKD